MRRKIYLKASQVGVLSGPSSGDNPDSRAKMVQERGSPPPLSTRAKAQVLRNREAQNLEN